MTSRSTEHGVDKIIDALAADARPVTALRSPWRRAATTLGLFALAGAIAIALSDVGALLARYAGREIQLAVEMAAILVTGLVAIAGAFHVAIPGRSRLWLAAPLPFLFAWLMLSGASCYRAGPFRWEFGDSLHCLAFITGTSAVLAVPLVWRLSRASPIYALQVALLGGLGVAALSAFLLHFYHPFDVTVVDLAVHLSAILGVTGAMALLRRPVLSPA